MQGALRGPGAQMLCAEPRQASLPVLGLSPRPDPRPNPLQE